MKVQVTQVKGHAISEKQAAQAINSFDKHKWTVTVNNGITPDTLTESDFTSNIINKSRLNDFQSNNPRKFLVKKSCLFNNLKFFEKVIDVDEPMVFAEHDALCIRDYTDFEFDEFCFLAMEYAFQPPTGLAVQPYRGWKPEKKIGVFDFPKNYPLLYYKENIYKNSLMSPGTAAYAITPKGAKKILNAVTTHGLDQSDFIINSYNIRMQYVFPSPVKYNSMNLNLSHRL